MKHMKHHLKAMLVFGVLANCPLDAETRLWTDATGKHKVEAEIESVDRTNVVLKTPSGRLITLPLDKLGEVDRAFVESRADSKPKPSVAPAGAPANTPGDMKINATGSLTVGFKMSSDGTSKTYTGLRVFMTALGGIAADALAVGPVTAASCTVDGKLLKMNNRVQGAGFNVVKRSQSKFFGHPENGIKVSIAFGEVPAETKIVGPLKGSLNVLTGGTEKEVMISNLLDRPTGTLADPILKAAGLTVKFTRTKLDDQIDVGISMKDDEANAFAGLAFAGLELVGADGGKVEAGGRRSRVNATFECSKSATKTVLKGAALRLRFREGVKVEEIPFDIPEVTILPWFR